MADFSEAIAYAESHEVPWPRDPAVDPQRWGVHYEDPPPFNRLRGPVHPRGGVSGVIRLRGQEVAAWGDPHRADLTFSVAKTYLALLAGVAHGRGLLPDAQTISCSRPNDQRDLAHSPFIQHTLAQLRVRTKATRDPFPLRSVLGPL